ncbi:copper chaperone PCu(A)C [Altererythrobacter sp. B11]|uniref:copper chaperone PCu(A)C n=1 Tax=Altererythrobacter sp. B11 TaxID=2060312 RepID=UPI001E410421|nr:copper chaperone PCu(A)C [Altererythrobacter sp. B11]
MYRIPLRAAARPLPAMLALAGAALLAGCNGTPTEETSHITITDPWSRETAPGQEVGGAFMTITNSGNAADRLVSGESSVVTEVQLHTMSMDQGVMKMRQVDGGLEIPAGGTVTLAPGGYHLMLTGLTQPLEQGRPIPLTLHFERAGDVEIQLPVGPIGATGPGTATASASQAPDAAMDHAGMEMQHD